MNNQSRSTHKSADLQILEGVVDDYINCPSQQLTHQMAPSSVYQFKLNENSVMNDMSLPSMRHSSSIQQDEMLNTTMYTTGMSYPYFRNSGRFETHDENISDFKSSANMLLEPMSGIKRKHSETIDLTNDDRIELIQERPCDVSSNINNTILPSFPTIPLGNHCSSNTPEQHRVELRRHMNTRERRRQFDAAFRASRHTSGGRVDLTVSGVSSMPRSEENLISLTLPTQSRVRTSERSFGRNILSSLIQTSIQAVSGPLNSRIRPAEDLQPTLIRGQTQQNQDQSRQQPHTSSCLVSIAGRPARMSITVTPQRSHFAQICRCENTRQVATTNPMLQEPLHIHRYVQEAPINFAYPEISQSSDLHLGLILNHTNFMGDETFSILPPSTPIYEEIVSLQENVLLAGYLRGASSEMINMHTFEYCYTHVPSTNYHKPRRQKIQALSEKCPICLDEIDELEIVRRLPCLHLYHRNCIDRWLTMNRRCPICRIDITTGIEGSIDTQNCDYDECSDEWGSDYQRLEESDDDTGV